MRTRTLVAFGLVAAAASAACGQQAGTLQAAADSLKVAEVRTIEYSGTGKWHQFGQAPSPTLPWPPFDVSAYSASVNYDTPAARVQMTRKQVVEPERARPAPVEQKVDQYVSGTAAWTVAAPAGSAPGTAPSPQPQPAAVEERTMEIWSTPHGFLKAALANNATSQPVAGGSEVTFTAGKNKYTGTINTQNQVEKIQTWIDNPVLGDTLVETTFSDYRDFDGVQFPAHIVRTQGGHPVLDLTTSSVRSNGAIDLVAPEVARNATVPTPQATAEKLAEGVWYIKGGSHHSVAVDQRDHIVVVEAPLNEARSLAVIAKVKETIPNKPIKYLVNTHLHFDHSGGLRTYVDEGATIVTHEMNRPYYEQAWRAPHSLNPDRLEQSKKPASFETFADKHTLSDGRRAIDIYPIQNSGHNDAFAMVYLPAEKILVEVDAYTPGPADAPPPATPNPFSVNLYQNIERLKLDVRQLAALHGPRLVTLADLRTAIGQTGRTPTN
jgi:glyoxylase-like metal-dependent hydrolase (beta-lactamase superfamily II)